MPPRNRRRAFSYYTRDIIPVKLSSNSVCIAKEVKFSLYIQVIYILSISLGASGGNDALLLFSYVMRRTLVCMKRERERERERGLFIYLRERALKLVSEIEKRRRV